MLPVPRGMPFPRYRDFYRIVACSYIDCLNAQFTFTQVHFVDLLSSYPLGRSDMGITVLGVSEILTIEDLELPVLLDKSENSETIVVVHGPKCGRVRACGLCRG